MIQQNSSAYLTVTNHLDMMRSVVNFAFAPANEGTTNSIPAFSDLIGTLDTNITAIDALRQSITLPITGNASQKDALRNSLAAMSAPIMSGVYTYAVANSNPVLANQMKTSPSALRKMKYDTICSTVKSAIDVIQPLLPALAAYNVTNQMVTAWTTNLAALTAVLTNPKNAIAHRKAINADIQALLRASVFMCHDQLDKLALSFRSTFPVYYNEYRANRKMYNYGHVTTQLRATVMDDANNPIQGAIITISDSTVTGTTAANGRCTISAVPHGMHTVHIATGNNEMIFGPYDFKMGQSLTRIFTMQPDFSLPATATPAMPAMANTGN